MNAHNRVQATHIMMISALKDSIVTHHYQGYSTSQYLPQMQLQAQQMYSNSLISKMIPHSHKIHHQFKVSESHTTLTLKNMNMNDLTHRLSLIFQSNFVSGH